MKIVPADRPTWTARPDVGKVSVEARAAPAVSAVRSSAPIDPFDAAEADFDFSAAAKTAAATLLRDQQQMKLAEMADAKAQGSVSMQTAVAAYREFEA